MQSKPTDNQLIFASQKLFMELMSEVPTTAHLLHLYFISKGKGALWSALPPDQAEAMGALCLSLDQSLSEVG